jgi:hypothetical protein
MKKTVPLMKTNLYSGVCTGLAMLTLVSVTNLPISVSGEPLRPQSIIQQASTPANEWDTVHSIQVSKSLSSKKHKIRLYPDARQQVLFFSANGEDGRVYQLFLFDMDGRLVAQTSIRNKETTVLSNIAEGNFLFEVFTDDERIENGKLTVK